MKPSEIREKPTAELSKTIESLKEEIFRLRFRHSTGQLKQTANIGHLRKDYARIVTELNARARAEKVGEEANK